MEPVELKLNLHYLIENIKDENLLNAIYIMLTYSKTEITSTKWDEMPSILKQEIEEGLEQAENGEVTNHSSVMEKYAKWL